MEEGRLKRTRLVEEEGIEVDLRMNDALCRSM